MLCCNVPAGIRKVADRFKSVFEGSSASYSALTALFCLHLYGCKGLSDLVRLFPGSPSVSALSRAVRAFNGNRFMRRMNHRTLRHFAGKLNADDFCYAVDDTDNPKYGDLYRCGNWHGSKGPYHGRKVLVLALVDRKRGVAIPIQYEFARKKGEPDYKSMVDLAIELLDDCIHAGFPKLPVTCDSWFDSADLMNALTKRGLVFAGEIKSTRLVRPGAGPNVPRRKLKAFFTGALRVLVLARPNGEPAGKKLRRGPKKRKAMAEAVLMINGVSHPVKVIAVYNKRKTTEAFAYYLSTDRSMSGAKLWALSRSRWAIEVLFRDLKQHLSFGRLPCAGKEAADLAVCMPFALIASLRLDDSAQWGLPKDEVMSIGEKVSRIRENGFEKSLQLIINNPEHHNVKSLRQRRRIDRLKRKPVQETAAERRHRKLQEAQAA